MIWLMNAFSNLTDYERFLCDLNEKVTFEEDSNVTYLLRIGMVFLFSSTFKPNLSGSYPFISQEVAF
jgi:hypothetical protein